MKIIPLTVGQMSTNCYLISDEANSETLIVDPGEEGDFISTTIIENKLIPIGIVLTHGHFDHCLAVLELKLNFHIPIHLHQSDLFLYEKAHTSASFWSHSSSPRTIILSDRRKSKDLPPPTLPSIDHFLVDNEVIRFGQSSLRVIHTPGHTPGSICLLSLPGTKHQPPRTSHLFSGDTLFANGVGSTGHSYSSTSDLKKSISKILSYPEETLIYPGHEDFGILLESFYTD